MLTSKLIGLKWRRVDRLDSHEGLFFKVKVQYSGVFKGMFAGVFVEMFVSVQSKN